MSHRIDAIWVTFSHRQGHSVPQALHVYWHSASRGSVVELTVYNWVTLNVCGCTHVSWMFRSLCQQLDPACLVAAHWNIIPLFILHSWLNKVDMRRMVMVSVWRCSYKRRFSQRWTRRWASTKTVRMQLLHIRLKVMRLFFPLDLYFNLIFCTCMCGICHWSRGRRHEAGTVYCCAAHITYAETPTCATSITGGVLSRSFISNQEATTPTGVGKICDCRRMSWYIAETIEGIDMLMLLCIFEKTFEITSHVHFLIHL